MDLIAMGIACLLCAFVGRNTEGNVALFFNIAALAMVVGIIVNLKLKGD